MSLFIIYIDNLYKFIYYYEAYGSFTLDAIGKTGCQIASSRVQHHQALGDHFRWRGATCLHTVEICLELTKLGASWLYLGYIPI